MTEVSFGRLSDLPLRDAWAHEAHEFTPWLAENIDHLSEVIGVPLEITDTEVRVETFAADILARNPIDDGLVLIENQLESTDHTHLGQIMTYLAGLEAQTVVWIAPSFREPHLTAIRWLNEHTADGFSFFAVRLRVVRIGESPFAPIFEIVEKPDRWVRALKSETRRGDLTDARNSYYARLAEIAEHSLHRVGRQMKKAVTDDGVVRVVLEVNRGRASIWFEADGVEDHGDLAHIIIEHSPHIESKLGPLRETKWKSALYTSIGFDLDDPGTWDEALAWHERELTRYIEGFDAAQGEA